MKEFAKSFYKSKRWQCTAKEYAKSVGALCELCKAQGITTAGEIVHHRVALTPENIHDPSVTLGWSNLELVCRECHALRHSKRKGRRRYTVDENGYVTACETPPSFFSGDALGDR